MVMLMQLADSIPGSELARVGRRGRRGWLPTNAANETASVSGPMEGRGHLPVSRFMSRDPRRFASRHPQPEGE